MDKIMPVPPVLTQAPVEPAPTKKSYKWLIVALIILLLTAASVFGYKYWQIKQLVQIQASPSPAAVLPSPSADPTANWLTYTNTVHNLGFKYPADWTLDKTGDSEQINARLKLTKGEAVITMDFNLDGIGGQGQTYPGRPFILDGHGLYRFQTENSYNNTQIVGITDSLTETIGVFKINGITDSIALSYPVGSTQAIDLGKEFDLILGTFKFTDQVQAIDTSAWPTYSTSGKYSLSFQYEPGGKLSEGNNPGIDIIHIVYDGKQLDWFIQTNDENLSLREFIQQSSNYNGSIEENKTLGQLTGTYIIFPEAQRGQFDFTGPSINFYFQDNQAGPLVHWIRLSFNKESLTESDYKYFDAIVKSVALK